MNRLIRNLLLASAWVAGTLVAMSQASASHPPCIRESSTHYLRAVGEFEDLVSRSRIGVAGGRYDVVRLRQTADRFQHAVRHHGDYSRFASLWQDLSALHTRVEDSLVAGCRQSDPRLFQAWIMVDRSYDRLAEAVWFTAKVSRGRHVGPSHFDRHDAFDRPNSAFDRPNPMDRQDHFGHRPRQGNEYGMGLVDTPPVRRPIPNTSWDNRYSASRPVIGGSTTPIFPVPPVAPIHGMNQRVDSRQDAGAVIMGALIHQLLR